jgi:two-component system CheB/CheR fusion protein
MNEELQSTNEELQAINEELRERSEELNRANTFLESVFMGVRSAVVVVDREFHVMAWSRRAEDMWGLRADEVKAQNFLSLDIGRPADQLRSPVRACFNGDGEHRDVLVQATNRRGKAITCRVVVTPLAGQNEEVRGAILMMDEQPAATVN